MKINTNYKFFLFSFFNYFFERFIIVNTIKND